jgi:colanic acid/amylovoran biosynthesis glycosyltransferase
MPRSEPQIRVLHVWDYRVNWGTNIDDYLSKLVHDQMAVSRVLTQSGNKNYLPQSAQHLIDKIVSPFPANIFLRQLSKLRYIRFLKSEIRAYQPDVIYFHFGQTAASLINPLSGFKIPFIVAFYGHDISVALRQPRWVKKYRIFSQVEAQFLVLSRDVKRRVADLGVDPARITIYNYPLELRPYLGVQKTPIDSEFNITIPGRLVEKKGHVILFQAMHLLNGLGLPVQLKVVGYGSDWAHFKRAALDAGIAEQIEWIDTASASAQGDFDTVYTEVLAHTNLVVLPCITSSVGDDEAGPALVLCLAQASGTPVLTTAFEGHEVSILDEKTGVIAADGDAEDLAAKIAWCINHPEQLDVIAVAGKEYVQKVFNQDSNLQIIFNVICSQAAESPTRLNP